MAFVNGQFKENILKAPTAKELVSFRNNVGYTQKDMAKALGLSQGTLSRWESGTHKIPKHFRLVLKYMELIWGYANK